MISVRAKPGSLDFAEIACEFEAVNASLSYSRLRIFRPYPRIVAELPRSLNTMGVKMYETVQPISSVVGLLTRKSVFFAFVVFCDDVLSLRFRLISLKV